MDPIIGGIISSLASSALETGIVKVTDVDPFHLQDIPILRHLRVLRLRQVERAVVQLQTQLRKIAIASDLERQLAFGNLGLRFFEAASKEHRDMKLALLAAAAVQPLSATNSDAFDLQLEFFCAVERLQPFHVAILAYLSRVHTRVAETRHEHLREATFAELLEGRLVLPNPRETWLAAALITLRELAAIEFEPGGVMRTSQGGFSPITEPYLIVRSCRFGLSEFGCRLQEYVQGAFDASWMGEEQVTL